MSEGRIEELLALAQLHVAGKGEGPIATALPDLWLFRFESPRALARSQSSSMFLSVALSGQKRMRVAGRDFLYDRLSYLVVRGETEYESAPIRASAETPYLALGLKLPPELVMRTLLDLALESDDEPKSERPPPVFQAPLDDGLADALCRLLRALRDPIERRVLAPLAVQEIVFRLLRSEAASVLRQGLGARSDRERIRAAMEFIGANAHKKLRVEALAKRAGMSPSHFAHRFREITSVSPMRYQKSVRLERARELLLTAGVRSSVAADRVGYLSEAQFSRDFKRQYGLSPAVYARAFERDVTALVRAVPSSAQRLSTFAESSKKNTGPALAESSAAR